MCTSGNTSLVPYGLKISDQPMMYAAWGNGMTQAAFEYHRAQMYGYNSRFRYGIPAIPATHGLSPYLHHHSHGTDTFSALMAFNKVDPRTRMIHEEPKPNHSYIGLIAMAILSHKDKKLVLSDIYQYILDNYAYFRTRGPGWRNSIRHNLSLNDCFIKAGRSANGKGHFWAIHPANIDDFQKGDFRRRRAQRKVRKHMGLTVPDDEDSPSPPPANTTPLNWPNQAFMHSNSLNERSPNQNQLTKKRQFDVESLLAPESSDSDKAVQISHDSADHLREETNDSLKDDIGQLSSSTDNRERAVTPERSAENVVCQSQTALHSPSLTEMNTRSSWTTPAPSPMGVWPSNVGSAWSIVTPSTRTTFSTVITPIPQGTPTPSAGVDTVQQWQETFSRIIAKSYSKNLKVES
ncbi:forkhead box protein I1-ema-like [Ptychodera flava]|uniref:forkhead box protein I1-ema-like n=1 Tax=Ptychodera flava TaxID=63121 RepID=UPI003969F431